MNTDILKYNSTQLGKNKAICEALYKIISAELPNIESKIWHGSPVWFSEGNPIVGYSVLKACVQLLFWSGQSFDEPELHPEGKFKASEARYTKVEQIDVGNVKRWLRKAQEIQWDYKNIVKKRGVLDRIK